MVRELPVIVSYPVTSLNLQCGAEYFPTSLGPLVGKLFETDADVKQPVIFLLQPFDTDFMYALVPQKTVNVNGDYIVVWYISSATHA